MRMQDNTGSDIQIIFDTPVNALDMEQTLDIVHDSIQKKMSLQIGVVNAAKIVNMWRQPSLRKDVLTSDLILADGSAVVIASKLLGPGLPERVAGIDLMFRLLERGDKHGYRVFCLGATEEVSKTVAENIKKDHPGVLLVGRHHGYFNDDEASMIADQIEKSRPDILFVAMTSPKKEQFLARWSGKIGSAVCHGVGGSFDVYAGKVDRAPIFWQKMGLEWLYRVKQEPRRLWKRYLVTNLLFLSLLAFQIFKKAITRNPDKESFKGIRY